MNNYIMERQIDAHQFAIPNLIANSIFSSRSDTFTYSERRSEGYGTVVENVNNGKPIPIILLDIDAPLSTSSHWVVAIGYGMNGVSS